jgi:hypothetical protein
MKMKNLLIVGLALPVILSGGIAMATSDQVAEKFQTLGQVQSIQTSAVTQMTGTDLQAVEGKMRWRGGHRSYSYSSNRNTTHQTNLCVVCSARGHRNGGFIDQVNVNSTVQR